MREIHNHEADGKRVPCPTCGSTLRDFRDTVVCHMGLSTYTAIGG